MTTDAEPQFGRTEPAASYRERPAAFGIVEREDGLIACVLVSNEGGRWYDLPGGALDAGEDDAQALVREFGEETGLKVAPVRLIARARQFFRLKDGEPVNNLCALFEARALGADATLKIEDDHHLDWKPPLELIATLRHDAHAWAVATWLRTAR